MDPNTHTRFGQVIRIDPEQIEAYKQYHAAPWPEINEMIRACHIENYSIFLKDDLLFAYFEYSGEDLAADMARMAEDERTQAWWAIMNPMQRPLETRSEGEWWAGMQEVYHLD